MSDKAQRAEIQIGPHVVEGFMLPDGSYVMSQTQAAEIVGLKVQNVSDFLRSKAIKGLLGEGFTPQISEIEPDADQLTGGSRIRGLSLEVVAVYWVWQASRGNKTALALTVAMVTETLERRFDVAFGIAHSEDARNQRLSERLSNRDLEALGILLAEDDDLRRENVELRRLLAENGLDPYALPGEEGGESS